MIKNIRVKNFKSLRDVSVDLAPITVLVGRGGSGKSNFVNSIAFLRDCLQTKQAAIGTWGGPAHILWSLAEAPAGERAPEIEFFVRFEIPDQVGDFEYIFRLGSHGRGMQMSILSESLTHDGEAIFDRRENRWIKQPAMIPLPQAEAMTLELASGIPEIGHAFVMLTAGIGCYDFSGEVLRAAIARNRQRGLHDAGLADDASNYLESFESIARNLQNVAAQREILAALRQLKPSLRGLTVAVPGRDHMIVALNAADKDVILDLAQESEGFRRFFAHLIALYQVPSKTLMTFEEPEKGLYAGALSVLADQIKSFASMGRGQVILTTHNPLLLDHFEPDQIRVVEMEGLETKIGPISKPQLEALHEQLTSTGELLTVDPARIASDASG